VARPAGPDAPGTGRVGGGRSADAHRMCIRCPRDTRSRPAGRHHDDKHHRQPVERPGGRPGRWRAGKRPRRRTGRRDHDHFCPLETTPRILFPPARPVSRERTACRADRLSSDRPHLPAAATCGRHSRRRLRVLQDRCGERQQRSSDSLLALRIAAGARTPWQWWGGSPLMTRPHTARGSRNGRPTSRLPQFNRPVRLADSSMNVKQESSGSAGTPSTTPDRCTSRPRIRRPM
jgi:hypothetical protein